MVSLFQKTALLHTKTGAQYQKDKPPLYLSICHFDRVSKNETYDIRGEKNLEFVIIQELSL